MLQSWCLEPPVSKRPHRAHPQRWPRIYYHMPLPETQASNRTVDIFSIEHLPDGGGQCSCSTSDNNECVHCRKCGLTHVASRIHTPRPDQSSVTKTALKQPRTAHRHMHNRTSRRFRMFFSSAAGLPQGGSIMCSRTTRITDRRRKRALAANPASEISGASKLKRGAAVRVHPLVRLIQMPAPGVS